MIVNTKTISQKFEHINKQIELNDMLDTNKFPDPILHKQLSFLKSGFRILACGVGVAGLLISAFLLLGVAEIIGVIEEMV